MDGKVPAVFEIYRNAAPILAAVDATRRDVVVVTIVAALALAVMLYLIFRAAQARLTRQRAALIEASRRDALTGLLNHGTAVAELATVLETARPSGAPVGVALLDIDNFRLVNETYGHAGGDRALVDVARVLREELSDATWVGRYGPDEFIVVVPPACVHDLEPAIERLRARRHRTEPPVRCLRAAADHVQHGDLLLADERRGGDRVARGRDGRPDRGESQRR